MLTHDRYEDWRGIDVVDPAGTPLGEVVEVLLDTDTDAPEWIVVGEPTQTDGEGPPPSTAIGLRLLPMTV